MSTVHLHMLGVACRVHCTGPQVAAEIRRLWRPFALPPGARDVPTVEVGDPASGAGVAGDELLGLATGLNRAVLAGTRLLATHAGVVEVGGGAVAFPAASGTGKSTLTVALLQLGAGYLSDEALCLDRTDGRVEPYPRPIGLSRWSAEVLGIGWPPTTSPMTWSSDGPEVLVSPGDVGGVTAQVAPPLRHVVLLQRSSGASRPVLQPAPQSEGVVALLSRSFNHWHDPRSSTAVVTGAVAGARVWTLQVGRPQDTAELVCEALSGG